MPQSNSAAVRKFEVLDPDVNFSDHLPLSFCLQLNDDVNRDIICSKTNESTKTGIASERRLRWDKADLAAYYFHTNLFTGLSQEINKKIEYCKEGNDKYGLQEYVNFVYDEIVSVLCSAAAACVPCTRKNYYKFWWNEELKTLKADSVKSNNL